ncbi:mannosyltransferase alg2-like protein [Zymoseptoria tritici IPO323]|uniref:Alpha-1,3/1,6-mannosyltransferase ALG2 n=1 Tax=Zymoseptoria tritici (strain CBS 115943 / IPO323) TaxID=336722 RepID=F9XJV5_ZYMTI|nr:mannosyltransferase alg2-like protein [Zymoseptoria tritici IPO323]EGP84811.1 mannosyltransferase alg2-like protein [Zymoseptoria tritici IPO323]
MATRRNIVFVHPDLGIGGAERLIIDAAVGLQSNGHKITILTSYRDTNHCFEEARDGTLDVRVRGDAIFPPSLFGRFAILCTILRQLSLVASTVPRELPTLVPDVIIVDQLSACIPFFRLLYPKAKVLFYGHYPDRLLVQQEVGSLRKVLKKLYRLPFDAFEGWSTGCADGVVVNSKYTRSVFRQTFPDMKKRELKVVYPCVDTSEDEGATRDNSAPLLPNRKILLSINRFERKKNLALAINAYAGLAPSERSQSTLILAGGFDPRNAENALTHTNLQSLADSLRLTHATLRSPSISTLTTSPETDQQANILFLLSIPSSLKSTLLQQAKILIYTPSNEHFGIVPLEAMLSRTPVLATNTGGPLETIYDGRTGWLRSPEKVDAWTDVLRKGLISSSEESLRKMGEMGRERVLKEFSREKMTRELEGEVERLIQMPGRLRPGVMPEWMIIPFVGLLVLGMLVLLALVMMVLGMGVNRIHG